MVRQSYQLNTMADKWSAFYCRLSRDDDNAGDSNSIQHQKQILEKYARDHGITHYKFYVDDGFSGTNFDRPGFREMLADIEAGSVDCVIVKDMSRFGRNYLEVGTFSSEFTRRHNNANVLCLGARVIGSGLAEKITETFLASPFEGGKHQRRIDMFD